MNLEYGTQRTKNVLDPRIPMRHREDSVASLRRGVNGPSIASWQSESCFQPQTVRLKRGAPSRLWSLSAGPWRATVLRLASNATLLAARRIGRSHRHGRPRQATGLPWPSAGDSDALQRGGRRGARCCRTGSSVVCTAPRDRYTSHKDTARDGSAVPAQKSALTRGAWAQALQSAGSERRRQRLSAGGEVAPTVTTWASRDAAPRNRSRAGSQPGCEGLWQV